MTRSEGSRRASMGHGGGAQRWVEPRVVQGLQFFKIWTIVKYQFTKNQFILKN